MLAPKVSKEVPVRLPLLRPCASSAFKIKQSGVQPSRRYLFDMEITFLTCPSIPDFQIFDTDVQAANLNKAHRLQVRELVHDGNVKGNLVLLLIAIWFKL